MKKLMGLGVLILAAGFLLNGCAAAMTAMRYKDLKVDTKPEETIFLRPVPQSQKTVWLEVKDTSGKNINLSSLHGLISSKGYKIVSDPEAAHYWYQVNVRYLGEVNTPAIREAMHASYGGPLGGAIGGGVIGGMASNQRYGTLAGALVGGVLGQLGEWVAGELVKKVEFGIIVDAQLAEKSDRPLSERQTASVQQGIASRVQQDTGNYQTDRVLYRNRLSATAVQVNLDLETAKPALVDKITQSLVGVL